MIGVTVTSSRGTPTAADSRVCGTAVSSQIHQSASGPSPGWPILYENLPPMNVISATGSRSTRGPRSFSLAGSRSWKTLGGSRT